MLRLVIHAKKLFEDLFHVIEKIIEYIPYRKHQTMQLQKER